MVNFNFDVDVYVRSFTISLSRDGTVIRKTSTSNKLTEDMKALFKRVSKGSIINFEDIVVRMPDGEDRLVGGLKLKVQ